MSTKKISVYSTPTCPWCKKTKKLLEDSRIAYQDFNIAEDKKARDEMVQKSGQLGVPVIEIDGEIAVGYDEAWLKEKLGLSQ